MDTPSGAPNPTTVRSGIRIRIGTTAMSCMRSVAKVARPPPERMRFFSERVWSTMAVEDSDSSIPSVMPICQLSPSHIMMPVIAAVVPTTCNPPRPTSRCRMSQSARGSNSSPIRNSIITTPNSAKCWRSVVSVPARPRTGPTMIPAAR